MSADQKIKKLELVKNYTSEELKSYWKQSLKGDSFAKDQLKYYYMKNLSRIQPLYSHLDEDTFYLTLEDSVNKALDRGIKFQVEDFESYLQMSSQTYFKYFLVPESTTLTIPAELLRAYSRIGEIYEHIPSLKEQNELDQIELLSKGLEYPIFLARLLYYSFIKWQNSNLRQVDIDLTVNLLPSPQRIEWEVFYEKGLADIESTILQEIEKLAE